ncbi:hypothetical protein RCG23_13835 [Neobacillus sp. PS3-34]|uniref:hypothetical protein n=1 Tax=Neobacillus sp. PS3-34 TaxID=3070678 RepID=UPI0027DF9DC2|nr:hypothetical protein [Neobacillus sp. PS3-34]WML46725.1 hypothetical protein RCG23_13835 [Neobacillus sp. PS3-34]
MNANEFNILYDEIITKRLQEQGYFKKGKSMFLQRGTTMAVLLRNTFRGDKGVEIIFGVRHTFVRDYLNLSIQNLYLTNPMDYPFQFSMMEFNESNLFTISTTRYNQKVCDYIYYGETDIENSQDLRNYLEQICDNVIAFGPKLINLLSPKKSMDLIEKNINNAWIERIRLEDYKEFLLINK